MIMLLEDLRPILRKEGNMTDELEKFFRHRTLPASDLTECWQMIVVPSAVKRILLNYAKAMNSLDGVSPAEGLVGDQVIS